MLQSFCDDMSHGQAGLPAQLQDASNRQANDDESADEHTDRGQSTFARIGFAHLGTEVRLAGGVRGRYCTSHLREGGDWQRHHGPPEPLKLSRPSPMPAIAARWPRIVLSHPQGLARAHRCACREVCQGCRGALAEHPRDTTILMLKRRHMNSSRACLDFAPASLDASLDVWAIRHKAAEVPPAALPA